MPIQPGAYAGLPYTSKVTGLKNWFRRCEPAQLVDALKQLMNAKTESRGLRGFGPEWYVHEYLGQNRFSGFGWTCVMQSPAKGRTRLK